MSLTDKTPLLLHNPNCSKSRAAKGWLEGEGIEFTERLYLEDKLSKEQVLELRALLGAPMRESVRSGEGAFAEAGLSANSSDEEFASAIEASPILLERPILVHKGRAAIGRPLSKIMELFED
ncbi:MAG: arsenate reductase [Candidatus Paceibacteria bacterium]|jgi:arsenate reductase